MSQLISSSIRRYLFISRHFYMTKAMTIMTNWNKILQRSIFSISINMMNYQKSFVKISTIITFLFKNSPCISSVRVWHLSVYRISIPFRKLTNTRTKDTSSFYLKSIWSDTKRFVAFYADSLYLYCFRFKRTGSGTKSLRFCGGLFRNELRFTELASIFNYFLSSVNPPTLIAASNVSFLMAKRNCKILRADRTNFINLFHKDIVS